MVFLRSVQLTNSDSPPGGYPWTVPFVRSFPDLELTSPITLLAGENGSGKSTFLEALALAVNLPTVGGQPVGQDPTLQPVRPLATSLKLVWNQKTFRGFFLRTEDFFSFAQEMARLSRDLADEAAQFEGHLSGYGLQLAKGALLGQRAEITRRYGENLDANSHGEALLKLLQARLVPGGLYLMDEPETPFSPQRQLALMSLILQSVREEGCQFIIATHSPLLLALPEAEILSFDQAPLVKTTYDQLEQVRLVRDFLNNPQAFLKYL